MAPDPARLAARARATLALATLASVLFLAAGAVILVTNEGQEDRGSGTRSIVSGDDYITAVDVFWPGQRNSGHWHSAPYEDPDLVRLVAGTDVARILAGQEPEHVYETFPAWSAGGVGDVSFVTPRFTCSGPTGGCDADDLPAIVFTRGDDWVGSPPSAFVREGERRDMPVVVMTRHEAWVAPALVTIAALATVALAVALLAGVTWRIAAKRSPSPPPAVRLSLVGTETPLQLVHLSRLYLDSMARSLYVSAGLAVVVGTAAQVWGLTYIVDGLLEDHFPLGGPFEAWIWLLHWWIIPVAFTVAAIFWTGHLRELRAERRRWLGISDRLSTLETQALG